jgi:feruloyl-CoA synthase
VDEHDPSKGMIFNGRLAEDFKLGTGTWVSVGIIKAQLIAEGNGLIQDAVITGHDQAFVGAIIFPDLNYCRSKFGITDASTPATMAGNADVLDALGDVLARMSAKSTGSSTVVRRATIADFVLSFDKGEITDKGSINQRMILDNHAEIVEKMYSPRPGTGFVEARE